MSYISLKVFHLLHTTDSFGYTGFGPLLVGTQMKSANITY